VPMVQRRGLGAFLMTLLKLLAKKNQLDAIMLTVMNVRTSSDAYVVAGALWLMPSCCKNVPDTCTQYAQWRMHASQECVSSVCLLQANTAAMKMYTKLGYQIDPTSPSRADPVSHLEEPTGYEILSLSLGSRQRNP